MARPKSILAVILVAVILAGGLNYAWLLKIKISKLKNNIDILNSEKQVLVNSLNKEKNLYNALNEEYKEVQNKLKVTSDKLNKIDADFQNAQKAIDELNARVSILRVEGETMRKENEDIKFDLNEVTQEKNSLQDKFNSVTELKKAIKELKKQRRQVMREVARWVAPRPGLSNLKDKEIKSRDEEIKIEEIFEGNKGFLIKDKKPTYKAKVKIEVEPFNR
jgi:chromosome segregation ATPase